MGKFADNIYNKYVKMEWSKKFQCAGIYSISVDNILVYIGKSTNILYRMAEHWVQIAKPKNNKYNVLAEAKRQNRTIKFSVLYTAQSITKTDIENEIGEKEGYFIRKNLPPLNYQIPNQDNWKSFSINPKAQTITLKEILNERSNVYDKSRTAS